MESIVYYIIRSPLLAAFLLRYIWCEEVHGKKDIEWRYLFRVAVKTTRVGEQNCEKRIGDLYFCGKSVSAKWNGANRKEEGE